MKLLMYNNYSQAHVVVEEVMGEGAAEFETAVELVASSKRP